MHNKPNDETFTAKTSHDLISKALQGDKTSRTKISTLAHPLIEQQTDRCCRRFCHNNHFYYRCTLTPPKSKQSDELPLCEWANASYGWMLDELTKDARLHNYKGTGGANLKHYFIALIHSLTFYERWKNWRFDRRIHVPSYIESMGKVAEKIFLALREGDNLELIANKVKTPINEVKVIADGILIELTKRKRLHLLNPAKMQSLSIESNDETEDGNEMHISDNRFAPDTLVENEQVKQVWQRLEPVEQYVLEALVIDEVPAEDVLNALIALDIVIKKDVLPEHTNVQQLYYFKRKCLAKLARLLTGE